MELLSRIMFPKKILTCKILLLRQLFLPTYRYFMVATNEKLLFIFLKSTRVFISSKSYENKAARKHFDHISLKSSELYFQTRYFKKHYGRK